MLLALLNPQAGGGRAARLAAPLARALAQLRPGCRLHVAASVADALAQIAALPRASRVLIVGGDGTVNRLLPALLAGGHTLALVPCGSGNDTARALGLHRLAWRRALEIALEEKSIVIDIGEARFGEVAVPFISSFSAGFDAAVCRCALAGPRLLTGLPRYLLATLREVAALRNWRLRVTLDDVLVHDGPALFAASLNTPNFGGGMPAAPAARIDDGRLDLLLAGAFGRGGVLAMLPRLMAGRHLGDERILARPDTRMRIEAASPIPLAADGEVHGEASQVELRVRPAALGVVAGRGCPAHSRHAIADR